MKAFTTILTAGIAGLSCADDSSNGKTIMKVVKLLQDMADKSKEDGEKEAELYKKFKCFCETNTKEKEAMIKKRNILIDQLQNTISELTAENGSLETACAKLKKEMQENRDEKDTADALRKKNKEKYDAEETFFHGYNEQLKQAMDALEAVAGVQLRSSTKMSSADAHAKVKEALLSAKRFVTARQEKKIKSFLEVEPVNFAGAATGKSAEIKEIIEQMKVTIKDNLDAAKDAEEAEIETHERFTKTNQDAYDTMDDQWTKKQEQMGANEEEMANKKNEIEGAEKDKEAASEFLADLTESCEKKAADFQKRESLRANEEAALSKAIAILNSDEAFHAFSKTDATSTGPTSLLQKHSVREHQVSFGQEGEEASVRMRVERVLENASKKSQRVRRVASLVYAENPFDKVLGEITKMLKLIDEEGKLDQEKLDWCNEERTENDASHDEKTTLVDNLETDITELDTNINDPEKGFIVTIADTETDLEVNMADQEKLKGQRKGEHEQYLITKKDLKKAHSLLEEAKGVLEEFYAKLEFVQVHKKREDPPETWEGDFKGQSEAGADIIKQLEFIITNTEKEEAETDGIEESSVSDYETSMGELTSSEESMQSSLVQLKKDLAEAQLSFEQKTKELKTTKKEIVAIKKYLEEIKPGCDFITDNFDVREANRATESDALELAEKLLKETAAYKKAAAK